MRESPLAVSTVEVHLVYDNVNTELGYTDAANHTFTFTRVPFLSLSAAAKHRLCSGGILDPDDLAPGTFLLLLDEPLIYSGESLSTIAGVTPCCCHCAPRLHVAPWAYGETETEIGTRTYTDPEIDPEPIYANTVTFGIRAALCRRQIAFIDDTTADGPHSLTATLATLVTGSEDPARDHEVSLTWDSYPGMSAAATVDWADAEGIEWRFSFSVSRSFNSYFPALAIPTVQVMNEEEWVGTENEGVAADAPNRFRLSALRAGGRIGFIGVYGRQAISGLNLTDEGGDGYAYTAVSISLSSAEITTWSHFTTGRSIAVEPPCPADWSASETFPLFLGEDETGSATIEITHD